MSLLRNSSWNIVGLVLPLLVAIPAMAVMARSLGVESFGLFTLAYAIIGYASIFDGGLSRAVTRAVAINNQNGEAIKKILGSATCFVLLASLMASMVLVLSAEALCDLLSVSEDKRQDTITGLRLLSIAIPPYLLSVVWMSYLEGLSKFFKLNVLKSATGFALSLAPLTCVLYTASFTSAITGLVIARIFSLLLCYARGLEHYRRHVFKNDKQTLSYLLKFGGWVTVSNVISPLMVYSDRFFISSVVGANSVAFYTAPAEVINRLLSIPGAIARVIFPKLSENQAQGEIQAAQARKMILLSSVCLFLLVLAGAELILHTLVGEAYAENAANVFRILALGFVFNSLAQVPYAKIQAAGKARITALVHTIEIVPYAILLYFMVDLMSIKGAAIAWTTRVFFDYLLLEYFSKQRKLFLPGHAKCAETL